MRACPLLLLLALNAAAQDPLRYWSAPHRAAHEKLETALVDAVQAQALRSDHDLLASRPHRAGSDGDLHVVRAIAGHFRSLGLAVEQQEIWVYLARPVAAELELLAPERMRLPLREKAVDAYSAEPSLSFGWNAYSGSGEVTAGVVYANHGTRQDFEKLAALGIKIKGKIVIARYGGNFRGYKAKFAEAGGAAGLVIYTDPADSGWGKGLAYPEGGYANGSYIQRGSILTLPYRGDPLTPFVPATKEAERLDAGKVAFPKIPVQPVGWDAARAILSRMQGASVPNEWQGGLPFRYRLTGGDGLKLRLMVKQERKLMRTFNVTGTLEGSRFPEQFVVAGAHHDAWEFGAADPTAGTILVLEAARCFAEASKRGLRPARSIVFAAWAAEEYGIMGSVEWVEAHRERLSRNGIAYLNLDMASMGMKVHSSAAPSLKGVLNECIQAETGQGLERFGNLGGGSDHIGFYCHVGIPSAGLSAGGSPGTSYHSNYDNLAWYRKVVGADYKAARQLARIVNRFLARVANADLLPLDPVRYGIDLPKHLAALVKRAEAKKFALDVSRLESEAKVHVVHATNIYGRVLGAIDKLDPKALATVNVELLEMERAWMSDGLPRRPWFKNLYAAADEDSGYAAWMLPGLRYGVERNDRAVFKQMMERYLGSLRRLHAHLLRMDAATRDDR